MVEMNFARFIRAYQRAELVIQMASHSNNPGEECNYGVLNCGRGDVGEPIPACEIRKYTLAMLEDFDKGAIKHPDIYAGIPFMREEDKEYVKSLGLVL